jgi:hypothetical protein
VLTIVALGFMLMATIYSEEGVAFRRYSPHATGVVRGSRGVVCATSAGRTDGR